MEPAGPPQPSGIPEGAPLMVVELCRSGMEAGTHRSGMEGAAVMVGAGRGKRPHGLQLRPLSGVGRMTATR